jgi:hypothetical protein
VEVIGREVRTEVGAVAEDGPILHQPVSQERLLARHDVCVREEDPARGVGHGRRNGRSASVSAPREHAEHEEPEDEHEQNRLNPHLRDEQRASDHG